MQEIKEIKYGTSEYCSTLKLRNKVMRIPMGLDIYNEDLSSEKDSVIIGMFKDDVLLGTGIMSHDDTVYKVEFLCTDTSVQNHGIGGCLLEKLEKIAMEQGATKICMDARLSAKQFYQKNGYDAVGEIFLMDCAPIDHIVMEKYFK